MTTTSHAVLCDEIARLRAALREIEEIAEVLREEVYNANSKPFLVTRLRDVESIASKALEE